MFTWPQLSVACWQWAEPERSFFMDRYLRPTQWALPGNRIAAYVPAAIVI